MDKSPAAARAKKKSKEAASPPSQPPGAPTKKRKRRSEWDDEHVATEPEDGVPINPPIDDEEDDRPPPPLKSMIGVDAEGTGVFYCPVDECEDDGAVILHAQDGERMNINIICSWTTMGFLGGAHGNAAIAASMDTKFSRVTTTRSSGLVGCSRLLGAPGAAMIRRLTALHFS
jgi:hypothetical protein